MNTTLKKILPLAMAAFLSGGCAAKNAPDPSPAPTGTAHAPADGYENVYREFRTSVEEL